MKSLVTALLCALFILSLSGCAGEPDPAEVVVGHPVPDFSLSALDGTTVKGSSLKGNIVVLNFWATWCQPCMSEIPDFKQLAGSSKARVVSIALDQEGLKTIKPFVETNQINYMVLVGNEEIFRQFNGVGIPYTLVLDRSQRIFRIYRGPATKESLEEDFKAIEQGA
jgi:peroxiredoxin